MRTRRQCSGTELLLLERTRTRVLLLSATLGVIARLRCRRLGHLGKQGAGKEGFIFGEVDLDALEVRESHCKVGEDIRGKEWHYQH